MSDNLPEHPVDASLAPDGDAYVLTMERELAHPVEGVWAALTRPADVVHWAPYRPDRELTAVGPVVLADNGDDTEEPEPARVVRVEPPHLLVLDWGGQELTYRLAATEAGTLLHFTHRFDDRNPAPSYGAGWHLCWSALMMLLDGDTPPRLHGGDAERHGWAGYREQYEALLG
ncbi:SRPBCC family protein [Promicromonospora sukumoe]|uniref:Uncharacterized protein YndB with AHSA1/START domain n=1 Tax=Promicromonospora sukumoe TaxID=88382 RepID=A0A7W3JEF4_9MICO|nr:SRPBCC domain-containing protein [Promicromonospora sukumoe]MBA8811322.1 uncharacterized protein YndB with AHSA1/START domain [Promicromonospora sukumoe]